MPDFLDMSDEEFAKQTPPVVEPSTESAVPSGTVPVVEPTQTEPAQQVAETAVPPVEQVPEKEEPTTTEPTTPEATTTVETPETVAATPTTPVVSGSTQETKPETEPVTPTVEAPAVIDFEAEYKKILTPFKANGKMVQVNDLDEARKLMQMGANFTKKMQEIQPHRKVLMMLDNHGLLDEGKLSFLIDLEKKNPEAIKKLIKESGINPMEIDVETEPAYQAGNHRVTNEEAQFRTILDDLGSNPEGKETLQIINREWDQASKEELWKQPDVMNIIHEQRESGVYDIVSAEVDRLRTLGTIPGNVPFIQAYKVVGENLGKAGKLNNLAGLKNPAEPGQVTTPVPVAQRVVAPKPVVSNSAQAQAASQQRSAPRKAEVFVNPLAMSDDDFLAKMKNRV